LDRDANHFILTPGYRSRFGPFVLGAYTWILNDQFDGELHADYRQQRGFGYGPDVNYLRYGVIGASGTQTHLAHIDLPAPRLPHDMAITKNYSVLMDLPLVQDQEARKAGKYRIFYDPSLVSRFAVIPRHADGFRVRWFEAKPCYIYHVVNS